VAKIIAFKIHPKKGEMKNPRWVECETENTDCPLCHNMMVVVQGKPLYAVCGRCNKYFIGE